MLTTVNICGRHYVLQSEVARFNARAAAGEFAKPLGRPEKIRIPWNVIGKVVGELSFF
jgi:hypothetical protein